MMDTSVNLYAFVGKRVSLTEYDPNADYNKPLRVEVDSTTGATSVYRRSYIMDHAFDAKYIVMRPVFNDLKTDTVAFKAFDHYGQPAFEKYDYVLLYLSKSDSGNYYFHQKYSFDPLKKKKNGSYVGEKGKSLRRLFNIKKNTVFKARGLFRS
ncbi:hypothetical protein FPE01S_01_07930 [Flavihumibacter petaseus NBRC 106054]|uniref:Uncharacterized protein n=2 Tax=Flavihumibacter TaxID=1004301 RepID=A0A0E9MW09_9BACT|nr:hypothetical protein FPE01S_01_07930 [Flavihumibacter petaseus NBRC 106054]